MKSYSSQNTAILIVDPFNDFLSEGGKRWSKTKETVKGVNLIEKLKSILSAARSFGINIIYVPHHQTEKGDYLDWKFKAPSHQGCLKYPLFEKGSWGGELNCCLKKEIILHKIIGQQVDLQIQILIFC
jgi:nicotinamidase-related amidase